MELRDSSFQNLEIRNKTAYLGMPKDRLEELEAIHTAIEIEQQPGLWIRTYMMMKEREKALSAFLKEAFSNDDLDVILTGAGSSAFIGTILQGPLQKNIGRLVRAIATTDLLSHPLYYFSHNRPLLLISFARSGNSPESLAVPKLAKELCRDLYHLVITCNASGQLAAGSGNDKEIIVLLPQEADDKSLVMTSSFSSMLLAGALISRLNEINVLQEQVKRLVNYGEKIISEYTARFRELSKLDFERAIILGSGALLGIAEESQLKIQELTSGKVVGKYDSFLGFRHGPRAVINHSSLLIYLFSSDDYSHNYEADLVNSVNTGEKGLFSIGISEKKRTRPVVDLMVELSEDEEQNIEEEFLPVCFVLPAQLIGFFKCLQLNLRPDNPSDNGAITRIVQGVNIYPFDV